MQDLFAALLERIEEPLRFPNAASGPTVPFF